MPTKTKNHSRSEPKRHGHHHHHSKQYKQVYWPFIPMLIGLLAVLVISLFPRSADPKVLGYATDISQTSLLSATNAQRVKNNQQSLTINEQLSKAAQAKADDMAARDYWSHNTPDGQEPWSFIQNVNYHYYKAGENLAYGFSTSQATVAGWMNSEGHRANLLDESFVEVGFGLANAPNYQASGPETIVVAMYARPESLGAVDNEESQAAGAVTSASANNFASSQPITRAQALTNGMAPWLPFVVGILSGAAIVGLLANHGLRLRRFFRKSEQYFVMHPLFDVSLIILALVCLQLSHTVGFIK